MKESGHFSGKPIPEHLKEARERGALASAEIHGTEMPGRFAAGVDAAKETTLSLLFVWIGLSAIGMPPSELLLLLILFSSGWLIWKTYRSAMLGWARLDRLHRVTEEERWEIQHHRQQEREELKELYRAKGLDGKLLEEVVDVFMSDDNRLLNIMLEEELGLTLEIYEHPLKQSLGAAAGVLLSAILLLLGGVTHVEYGLPVASGIVLLLSTWLSSKQQRSPMLAPIVWNLAIAGFAGGTLYFLGQLFFQ